MDLPRKKNYYSISIPINCKQGLCFLQVTVTPNLIIAAMTESDVPIEIKTIVASLDEFSKRKAK